MKIQIIFNNTTKTKINYRNLIKKIKIYVAKKFKIKFKKEIELGIHFVSKKEIQRLNLKYRNINQPTDVLSFCIYKNLQDSKIYFDKQINLGDIFICTSIAKYQAKLNNISQNKEIEKLAIHGFKHLIGIHHK